MASYTTLKALVQANPAALKDKKLRPYRVETESGLRYVLANSPGQAALLLCLVETVKPQELSATMIEVMCDDAKQKGNP